LRSYTIGKLDMKKDAVKNAGEPLLQEIAANDPKSVVRAAAITSLGKLKNPAYKSLFEKAISDSSYSVAGSGLTALAGIDTTMALENAKSLAKIPEKGRLRDAIAGVLIKYGGPDDVDIVTDDFSKMPLNQTKFNFLQSFSNLLAKVNNSDKVKRGVDEIVKFRDEIPSQARTNTDPYINNNILKNLANKKDQAGLKDQADYIRSKMTDEKKGF
ncbi:MAG TPA: HEAT repeat domain-containing protein, partial [Puia sp.]|nr:HEAT repeat domain-containing protein [Puia sp.]